MAKPTAGIYTIIPVSATTKALDVTGASLKDGANIEIWNINGTDAQTFQLTYRSDGTAQISNRLTGKCVDVNGGSTQSGTNVQMWTDNDSRAQKWDIADKSTADIDGETYITYEISMHGTSLCMDVVGGGTAAGTNVWVYTRNNSNAQQWVFIPVPPFRSGGVYEVRLKRSLSSALDVAGGSTSDGANVQLYSVNHSNAQKWVIVDEGESGWSVRNVASGKYLDFYGGTLKNGINVQSYQDNDTRAQRWSVNTLGTVACEGQTCQIVAFGAANGSAYMLDDNGGGTANGNNVQIYQSNGTDAQRWVLWPTWAEDPHMPSPYNLDVIEDPSVSWASSMSKTLHPRWECASAYATSGPNAYQIRYRTRKMSSSVSTWGAWGDWTSWATANVTKDGQNNTLTQGIDLSMTDDYKAMQFEYQIRATGVAEAGGDYTLLYGASASKTILVCPKPNVDFGNATLTADGLSVSYSCDYDVGSTNIYLESVLLNGRNILKGAIEFTAYDTTESLSIPIDKLSVLPTDEASVTLRYRTGSDQMTKFEALMSDTVSVAYASGGTSITPSFESDGYSLLSTIPDDGNTRVWITTDAGIVECRKISTSQSLSVFDIPFPMGLEYRIVATGYSGGEWFVWTGIREETIMSAHVWNLEQGLAVLQVRESTPLTTQDSIEADGKTWFLNARSYETVGFSGTLKHRFTAEGAVTEETRSKRNDFELLPGAHAIYRSPAGDVVPVAVLSVDREKHHLWTRVSVTMARESE